MKTQEQVEEKERELEEEYKEGKLNSWAKHETEVELALLNWVLTDED